MAESSPAPPPVTSSALLNSHPAAFQLGCGLRRLCGDRAAGTAYCVELEAGDNLALHHAIAQAPEESILVAGTPGRERVGYFGEIMAAACRKRGIRGLVIAGTVRDIDEMQAQGFPVFATGVGIRDATKRQDALRGDCREVRLPGGVVRHGDWVVADGSGVVIIPRAHRDQALEKASERIAREEIALRAVRQGKTTLHVLGLGDRQA